MSASFSHCAPYRFLPPVHWNTFNGIHLYNSHSSLRIYVITNIINERLCAKISYNSFPLMVSSCAQGSTLPFTSPFTSPSLVDYINSLIFTIFLLYSIWKGNILPPCFALVLLVVSFSYKRCFLMKQSKLFGVSVFPAIFHLNRSFYWPQLPLPTSSTCSSSFPPSSSFRFLHFDSFCHAISARKVFD